MNDPQKRIDVNLSSLLSLKAELLRKHDEVIKAKSSHLVHNFVPTKNTKKTKSEANPKLPKKIDEETALSHEDSELHKKSKKVLTSKSKFYDKMLKNGGALNTDENCLVMFNKKKQSTVVNETYSESSSDESDDLNTNDQHSHDWVDYTDCLGRTRKCHKDDIESFREKDKDLEASVAQRNKDNLPEQFYVDTKGAEKPDSDEDEADEKNSNFDVLSKSSKLEAMRRDWEKQEIDNTNNDYVHYQGVLFNEARNHGVGYFEFSNDEIERAKQQQELEAVRLKTLEAQHQRDEQRKAREKIIANRVKAARDRQRARLGLPPIDDTVETELQQHAEQAERLKAEELRKKSKKKDQFEKIRNDERKRHIRPWDKGKDGVRKDSQAASSKDDDSWQYCPEPEPMSQEQWNEKKRSERISEFAPTNELTTQTNKQTNNRTNDFIDYQPVNKTLKFTSKRIRPEPESELPNDELSKNKFKIPFATSETFIPKSYTASSSATQHLETSIEAGLRFLREQSDKNTSSTKMKWTSNADY